VPFLLLKFLHVGSMFLATALAVGPSILLYLVARTGDPTAIRRAFGRSNAVFRAGGASYGLGFVFGFAAALSGQLDLADSWLISAYVLVGVLVTFNLGFERWARRVDRAVDDSAGPNDLAAALQTRIPLFALGGMVVVTLLIVFVMVVKPSLF
jgi:hypothetical protein